MKGYWPIPRPRVRRCWAFYGVDSASATHCHGLIWPWQDVVREYDPECGGALVHHRCHHFDREFLWREDYGDRWTDWLNCEHTTDRLVGQ